jgi:DNA polymerase I
VIIEVIKWIIEGLDSVLKWMLITCFGYTGYRNAKFGRIEVHESITSKAREILLKAKEMAENMGFQVLHGIVDCLWLKGEPVMKLKEKIEKETGMLTEVEAYDWIVFLPMLDGVGSYNRYYGRLSDGRMKIRGIMARKRDTPDYVRRMQVEMLDVMRNTRTLEEVRGLEGKIREIYERYLKNLRNVDPRELVIRRRIGKINYSRKCPEASAIEAYRRLGIKLSPGMEIGYVVLDSQRWIAETEWTAESFDHRYYQKILEKAWEEVRFAFYF